MKLSDEALFPLKYLNPYYHMSPVDAAALEENFKILKTKRDSELDLRKFFPANNPHYKFTLNAREAIAMALKDLNLQPEDEVMIVTTSNGRYISGCVTGQIEKVCKWNREHTANTKAVFVIHEFGFPYENMNALLDVGRPIIEDCAYAYDSVLPSGEKVGSVGDYAVYSFSKAFPIPYGGLLTSKKKIGTASALTKQGLQELKRLAAYYLPRSKTLSKSRVENYRLMEKAFKKQGIATRFELGRGIIPYGFVLQWEDETRAQRIKKYMNEMGVESSVFYGSGGYFLPCHPRLGRASLDYIVSNFERATKTL